MNKKLKICAGCNKHKVIWKAKANGEGPFCKDCWKEKLASQGDYFPSKVVSVVKNKKVATIKPISDKKAKELQVYRRVRDKYMKEHPICEYPGCHSTNITLHHMAGRVGLDLINIGNFKSLCVAHHRWVEEHPKEAKKIGLSKNRI